MGTFKILRRILRATKVYRIALGFLLFFLIVTTVIWLEEPHIGTWRDSLWYCFSVVSTCGFGDIVVYSPASRVLSIILSVYAVIIIAMLTGVIVNFYNKVIESRVKGSMTEVMDKLERLPELSKEELEEISKQIKKLK